MTRTVGIRGVLMALAMMHCVPAGAQTIERLVMPGKLIEAHAELEDDCGECHKAFKRANQRSLCLDCHEEIAADIRAPSGFHGRSDKAREWPCASCHTDHEGRDADIVELDEEAFDHRLTDFDLDGKHADAACGDCHAADAKHRDAPSECIDCHEEDNVHEQFMGTACGDCHDSTSWETAEFDHDTTGYRLLGQHAETACLDCHEDRTFQGAPTTCYGCHEADDVHEGRSGRECDKCHNPTDWADTSFNHERDTEFALDGGHALLACGDCHSEDPFADQLETACVACHLEDDDHDGHFGPQCDVCHTATAWPEVVFDHDRDTDYALNGAHESIACEDCHVEPIFEVPLQTGCYDCHEDDDPHSGQEGTQCQDCHNETAWQDEVFFDHDLTRFPLLGAHRETECEGCHETHAFTDAPTACADCHRDDDPHDGRFHDDCAACHSPVDWERWYFDHDTQTDFVLDGAHETVACNDCHRQSLDTLARLGGRCSDCHRADDVHDGEFGDDCGRCHSAESFRDVRTIQ